MTVGARIRQIRGRLSREEFSAPVGVHPQTLYLYEKDKRLPGLELIHRICKVYDISVEWLTNGENFIHTEKPSQPTENSPERPVHTLETDCCARCAKLEAELELERQERREMNAENRQLNAENRQLAREIGELKTEVAIQRERLKSLSGKSVDADVA